MRWRGTCRGAIDGDGDTEGAYVCGGCLTPLFHSAFRFDAGDGWPAFFNGFVDVRSPPAAGGYEGPA